MTGFTNRKQLLSEMQKGDHLDWDIIVIGGSLINLGKNKSASDCHLLLNYVNNLLF